MVLLRVIAFRCLLVCLYTVAHVSVSFSCFKQTSIPKQDRLSFQFRTKKHRLVVDNFILSRAIICVFYSVACPPAETTRSCLSRLWAVLLPTATNLNCWEVPVPFRRNCISPHFLPIGVAKDFLHLFALFLGCDCTDHSQPPPL